MLTATATAIILVLLLQLLLLLELHLLLLLLLLLLVLLLLLKQIVLGRVEDHFRDQVVGSLKKRFTLYPWMTDATGRGGGGGRCSRCAAGVCCSCCSGVQIRSPLSLHHSLFFLPTFSFGSFVTERLDLKESSVVDASGLSPFVSVHLNVQRDPLDPLL